MKMKRWIALFLTLTLLFSLTVPAFADNDKHEKSKAQKLKGYEKFSDMKGYEWGGDDVSKVVNKGIFRGLGLYIFAPGAKITHQEAAVSAVRLIDKESEAYAVTLSEVENLIANIPDKAKIAVWAQPAVAQLVKIGAVTSNQNFDPLGTASRLDIAVLLVKALGHEAEAQAAMNKELSFRDANQIPADKIGYVYVATQLKLITGYADKTFRPNQAVKRIEAAIMMGRADYLVDHQKTKVVRGTVNSVDTQNEKITITKLEGGQATYTLSDEAIVYIDGQKKELVNLIAGMSVVIRLGSQSEAVLIEATTNSSQGNLVTGSITALVPGSTLSLPLITMNSTVFPVAANAVITVNNNSAVFSDLKVGDTATLTINAGLATKVAVTRAATTASGTIAALTAATGNSLAIITIGTTAYPVATNATYTVNSASAAFANLLVGDTATLTISSGLVTNVTVTRTVTTVQGGIIALSTPSAGQTYPAGTIGIVSVVYSSSGSITTTTYYVLSTTQILVNSQTAQFSSLQLGDAVKLTLTGSDLTKMEITR